LSCQQAALSEAKEKLASERNQEANAKKGDKQQMKQDGVSDKVDHETEAFFSSLANQKESH